MNITNLFKVSLKAVANNKMRSFLSMLGIIIGVAAVIIMMAIGQGSKESIRKELSTMGTNLLTIRPGADMRGGVRQDPSAMNLLRPSDAVTGQKAEGGWARMMNSGLSKEQIAAMPLEKYLGARGWTDPSEWM